jgi:hypothetical protein
MESMVTSDNSRAALNFANTAREVFLFLGDFGFQEVGAEETIVRYATKRIFFHVYHGRSSYELGIDVGLFGPGTIEVHGYSLGEFARLTDPMEAANLRDFCATTPEEVGIGLGKLAAQAMQYVARALRGDETVFSELERQQREWGSALAADVAYRQVSPKAAEAFREKNYHKAVELYESIKNRLTPAELKKFEYAKHHE